MAKTNQTSNPSHMVQISDDLDKLQTRLLNLNLEAHASEQTIVQPVRLSYSNLSEYGNTLRVLVGLETKSSKELTEAMIAKNVNVRWGSDVGTQSNVYFNPTETADCNIDFQLGGRYVLEPPEKQSNCEVLEAELIKITDMSCKEYCLRVISKESIVTKCTTFTIRPKWNPMGFKRMFDAIDSITNKKVVPKEILDCLCGTTEFHSLLNRKLPQSYTVPGVTKLDGTQRMAIELAIQRPVCLVQGPPGTGKTTTSTCIIYHLIKITSGRVLAVAPSNTAVDNLCASLTKTGLKVVRMCASSREKLPSSIKDVLVHVIALRSNPELAALQRKKNANGCLRPPEDGHYRRLKEQMEQKVLLEAEVVCCTCVTAGDWRLRDVSFNIVLVDECTQATEPECLIPISRARSQIILVGDHCQLGPVVTNPIAVDAGFDLSLFERLRLLNVPFVRLQTQYRMHPQLAKFSSCVFYDNQIENGIGPEQRLGFARAPWPKPNKPTFFYCLPGEEQRAAKRTSYMNMIEAEVVKLLVNRMMDYGISPQNIGVIAPYDGQRGYLTAVLGSSQRSRNVEVASVDAFQGREKDYIILSCVRSNENRIVGFLKDARRLNVALTRARNGLIIVGDHRTLSKDPLWNELLHFYKDEGVLVEGSINSFKPAALTTEKPSVPYRYEGERKWLQLKQQLKPR